MASSVKKYRIVKGKITINPGDLIHMDQVESSTPGRPLIHSGKNNKDNKNKICIVPLFVESISKKLFCELKHSTSAEGTVAYSHNTEQECKQSAIKI